MRLSKTTLPVEALAQAYYERARSILTAMIDATLKKNLSVVFVLNRPFLEACYRGMWLCVASNASKRELPSNIEGIAREIDVVIQQRFDEWGPPP